MGFKRRTKADIAINVLQSPMGQKLLDAQAKEIESRLAGLEAEEQGLRAELDSINRLRGQATSNGAPRRRRSNGQPQRVSRRGLNPDVVLAGIAEATKAYGEAPTIGQLSKHLGQKTTSRVRPVLKQLVADNAVKKTGSRRSTRYSLK